MKLEENPTLKLKDSPSVVAHIGMMQGIINRLADTSARCKEWCFAFIGALLVLLFSIDSTPNTVIKIIPYIVVGLFYILDSYYLGLERSIRDDCQNFVNSINALSFPSTGEDEVHSKTESIILSIYFPHLHIDKPTYNERFMRQLKATIGAMFSLSTFIPYIFLFIVVFICN